MDRLIRSSHFAVIILLCAFLMVRAATSQTVITGSYQLTANASLLGRPLPSVGNRLILLRAFDTLDNVSLRLEYYTEGSYNSDPPGLLLSNINEQKFEMQFMFSHVICRNFTVTAGLLHHENFTFTDHYFWLIAGVGYVFTFSPALSLTTGALVENKILARKIFYDLSSTIDFTPVKLIDLFFSLHRYENFGQTDSAPTEKEEIEAGVNLAIARTQIIGASVFRHIQFNAPNDQFTFAKLKYSLTF